MLAILADIHANLEALDAVLADVDARAPGARVVCAGDVVGYGPDPEACIERLMNRNAVVIRGNHEEMVLGMRDDARCVAAGIVAVAWTRRELSRRAFDILRGWPAVADVDDVVVCHGDLDDASTYVADATRAALALDRLRVWRPRARMLVCGHTHQPMWFPRGERSLVNPGAVGQARDDVVRARYALVDDDGHAAIPVQFLSVPYDHSTTVAKMRAAGLVARVSLKPPQGLRRPLESALAAAARVVVRLTA